MSVFTWAPMAASLPFLNPYKNKDVDFSHGVNFAVAGSTIMPTTSPTHDHIILSSVTLVRLRHNSNGCLGISDKGNGIFNLIKQDSSINLLADTKLVLYRLCREACSLHGWDIGGNDYNCNAIFSYFVIFKWVLNKI